ncbi:RNA polymerase factor sigma-54 [Gammaproteobacteria bacterium 42_54_T18]|nr:RNA polymerase factor sigma-54 [Gammaproteobacteria bacterium 42_54_T18]
MKPTLQLKIGQSLTMTPQLQQAIKLLQLSSLDLEAEIQEALDSNPMLEAEEVQPENDTTSQSASQEPEVNPSEPVIDFSSSTPNSNDETNLQSQTQEDATINLESGEIGQELPVDSAWEDLYQGGSMPVSSGPSEDDYDLDSRNSPEETLYDSLMWQLNLTPMSDIDQAIALSIIEAIDERGYLTTTLEDIRTGLLAQGDIIDDLFRLQEEELTSLGIDINSLSEPDDNGSGGGINDICIEEVIAVLNRIQQFDPPGVGAKDLGDCLLIQLKQLPAETPCRESAMKVVEHHIALLGSRDFAAIMRKTKLSEAKLQEVIELIQTLNPNPGASIASDSRTEYVVPEVIVTKDKGRWKVELNPETSPRLRINSSYASLIKRADSSNDNTFLKNNLQEARWFLKSLLSRSETLLKVATKIVEHQIEFFEEGEEAMKPLVLHDIAEAVEMHESTISRVTTQKYMHTPRGVFELKFFFSSHVSTASGGECSSTAIRAIIKKLIAKEEPRKPLSDSKLANLLAEKEIKVARRTIAKYREAMHIPPSNERKRLV